MVFLPAPGKEGIRIKKRRFGNFTYLIIIILLSWFILSEFAWSGEMLHYTIVSRGMSLGQMIYEIEVSNDELIYRSFFKIPTKGTPQKDAEFILNRQNLLPRLSKKWLQISEGEILLEVQYSEKEVVLTLSSPYGNKKTSFRISQPVYDMEQMIFLLSLNKAINFENRRFSVLVPASGMIWNGRMQKISEDKDSFEVKYTLAGEIIYLRYQKNEPYHLLTLRAPHRGYDLILEEDIE